MPKTPRNTSYPALLERRKAAIENRLRSTADCREPRSVYEPIGYVLKSARQNSCAI